MCQYIIKIAEENNLYIKDTYEFLLASVCVCILWKPMMEKRITKQLVEDSLSYFYIIARIYAYSCINPKENIYWQKLTDTDKISNITADFTENAFKILFNREPNAQELFEFKTLIGLTITNGPGTLSAKGAKESVSARNHISMSFVGFLSNTGFAHGGNGFEAVEFLINTFKDANLDDPGNNKHNINLKELANKKALEYAEYKKKEKETGTLNYKRIPCINHPVFKGNDVNIDPREQYVSEEMKKLNIYNVFLDFYHNLVRELYNEGVTKNVFCVNVDAVLAVITLKLVWNDLQEGKITLKDVQDIVFTLFLYGRAIGVAAEIADHRDRGLDMDCRTPQSQVQFVL
jgi:citrate synthase